MEYQKAILVQSFNRTSPEKSFIMAKEVNEVENGKYIFGKSEIIPMEKSEDGGNWKGKSSATKSLKGKDDNGGPYA